MRMPSMRIDTTARFILEGHLQLMRRSPSDDIAREDRAIVIDDHVV